MKERCLRTMSHIMMMAVFLIGVVMLLPGKAQAATQQVKFLEGYSNSTVTDKYINDIASGTKIRLPKNWKYTDKDVTITISNKNVAYLEYEKSEPNAVYINANYDVPYKTYKPVVVTATKTNAATGDKQVAKLNLHRYSISCVNEKKSVYVGTTFKFAYKTITDGKKWSGVPQLFYTMDESIATISSAGMVTAKKAGKTLVTVNNECGNATMELTVKPLPSINKKTAVLDIGGSTKLAMRSMPRGTSLVWKSSNQSVATVTNGVVKAKAPGKAVITVSYKLEGKTRQAKCTVTVNKPRLSKEKAVLSLHTSTVIKVIGSSQKVKWETTNKNVATVKDGKVTATGIGSCKIFATANGVKMTFSVQVRSNERNWKVVTRAGYYRDAYDDYKISKVKYNANGSITVEGYFVNTHIYNITSFDYMYIAVRDSNDNVIAAYKTPKFNFRGNNYTVNKMVLTIPANKVKRNYDFVKNDCSFDYDYVYNYR